MADRPVRKPSGLAEPDTVSGEMRQVLFSARHELAEAKRRIAELEAEAAQVEDRRRNVETDILAGIKTNMRGIIAAEVAAEVERSLANRPSRDFTLRIETPAPFAPVALSPGILPPHALPAPQPALAALPPMVGAPMAPGLSSTHLQGVGEQQAVADFAASQKAEQRLKKLGILTVPVCGLLGTVAISLGSHCQPSAPPYQAPSVYAQPSQPQPALPTLVRPPTPLPH